MSFEEKGTWLYLVIIERPADRLLRDDPRASSPACPVTEIDYQGRLLAAIGAAIGLAIVGIIVIAISSPTTLASPTSETRRSTGWASTSGAPSWLRHDRAVGLAMTEARTSGSPMRCTWPSSSPRSSPGGEARPYRRGF